METYVSPDCPPEVEESFLQHILAFEDADPVCPFDELVKADCSCRGLRNSAMRNYTRSFGI